MLADAMGFHSEGANQRFSSLGAHPSVVWLSVLVVCHLDLTLFWLDELFVQWWPSGMRNWLR